MNKAVENPLVPVGPIRPSKRSPDAPLPMDAPSMESSAAPITIDLTAIETAIEPPQARTLSEDGSPSAPAANGARRQKFAPLAASLAVGALAGILGGGFAAYALSGILSGQQHVMAAMSDENGTLRQSVANLSSELAALKSGIETASQTAAGQFGKIGERLDRAERAQADPASKLAKIAESVDRLERRMAAAPEMTGSVTTVEKQQPKPATVEGWRLIDYYAGRAVLESRSGTLFEVGPGANLPGVGRVETIKRVDGKIVVTTPKGVIASAIEQPRRPPYYLPRGY